MERVITIGDKDVRLSNNIAWTMEYRDQFGRDVVQEHVPVLASITEALAMVVNDIGTENVTVNDILGSLEGRAMDLMIPLMQTEFMSVVVNVTWAMAKACDENILPPKQWVRQFDEFPLDVIVPTVYELALKGFISSKNVMRLMKIRDDLKVKNHQPQ